jgi:hypothetical protein
MSIPFNEIHHKNVALHFDFLARNMAFLTPPGPIITSQLSKMGIADFKKGGSGCHHKKWRSVPPSAFGGYSLRS